MYIKCGKPFSKPSVLTYYVFIYHDVLYYPILFFCLLLVILPKQRLTYSIPPYLCVPPHSPALPRGWARAGAARMVTAVGVVCARARSGVNGSIVSPVRKMLSHGITGDV